MQRPRRIDAAGNRRASSLRLAAPGGLGGCRRLPQGEKVTPLPVPEIAHQHQVHRHQHREHPGPEPQAGDDQPEGGDGEHAELEPEQRLIWQVWIIGNCIWQQVLFQILKIVQQI